MSYYNEPEQPIEPPEMSKEHEWAIEEADRLVRIIDKLYDKVETFFEELPISEMENILANAEELYDEIKDLSGEDYFLEDELSSARWRIEEIEGWIKEKEDILKTEGDK
jgi:peptidoglycan hydrolase CwlO-like protein